MKKLLMIIPLVILLCFTLSCQDKEAMAKLKELKAQVEVEEENKEIIRRCMAEFDKKNLDTIDELYTLDYKMHSPAGADPISRQQNREMAPAFYAAFPDMTHTIDRLAVEGDMVAGQYTIRGTHKGDFSGIPPTGKEIVVSIIGIWCFTDGKLADKYRHAWNDDATLYGAQAEGGEVGSYSLS